MSNLAKLAGASLVVAALGAAAAPALAQGTAAPAKEGPRCFFITQWKGWKSPSPNVIYLGVTPNAVYRVDLSAGSPLLNDPSRHLISRVRGSSSICSALDLDLALSDGHGFSTPLIASKLTRLSPEEIAAIPPKYRPST
ncbi:MAG: hypothetical protein ABI376_10545 [Caulobacteraceae bacterium]